MVAAEVAVVMVVAPAAVVVAPAAVVVTVVAADQAVEARAQVARVRAEGARARVAQGREDRDPAMVTGIHISTQLRARISIFKRQESS
jgi:hypothetical protein